MGDTLADDDSSKSLCSTTSTKSCTLGYIFESCFSESSTSVTYESVATRSPSTLKPATSRVYSHPHSTWNAETSSFLCRSTIAYFPPFAFHHGVGKLAHTADLTTNIAGEEIEPTD
jgi:hypothetical protein